MGVSGGVDFNHNGSCPPSCEAARSAAENNAVDMRIRDVIAADLPAIGDIDNQSIPAS